MNLINQFNNKVLRSSRLRSKKHPIHSLQKFLNFREKWSEIQKWKFKIVLYWKVKSPSIMSFFLLRKPTTLLAGKRWIQIIPSVTWPVSKRDLKFKILSFKVFKHMTDFQINPKPKFFSLRYFAQNNSERMRGVEKIQTVPRVSRPISAQHFHHVKLDQ